MTSLAKQLPANKGETGPSQSDRFIDAARDLGYQEDEDEAAFEQAVRKVVSAKPPPAARPKSAPEKPFKGKD